MTFFFDNNLSPKLVNGLKAFGENVTHLRVHFSGATQDSVWLPKIGKKGWVLITADKKIRRKPHERQALKDNRVGAFVFSVTGLDHCEWIRLTVRRWSEIKNFASKTTPPYIYRVPSRGKIEQLI